MPFKDYYATLGVKPTATQDEIKRAYRKLARQYHPDVSKEPDAEARFIELVEAHEALIDVERRAAYDEIAQRHANGEPFNPPPGQYARSNSDSDVSGEFSDFFDSLFGRGRMPGTQPHSTSSASMKGSDQHAKVSVGLQDVYQGAQRMISLRIPVVDAMGRVSVQTRQLEVRIPKGVRDGQHLRLLGQGAVGQDGAPAGDLYLEIQLLPHPVFRINGKDISFDLSVAPWEAALGATVTAPTLDGSVQLSVPPGSSQGRKLRLKGKGLPGKLPGDLYAVLNIALPPSTSLPEKEAYGAFASAFQTYNPRSLLKA